MRKLAILTFLSLDGVMQAVNLPEEDTSNGFEHGGWANKYWDEVMAQVKAEAMSEPYDLLLGRKTYELFAEHNSKESDSNPLNDLTKYVVTNTLSTLEWKNSIPVSGDIVKEVTRLKSQDGHLLQVHGSWQLINTLLSNDLIDEFRLWTFPIVLGGGKRLFHQCHFLDNLSLVRTKSTVNGVIMSIYRRDK
ncbi:dihydrofolate reductase [Fulvivirga sp. M361]|nr:dihydrofolate reductase [Fulvivirga sp. M361]